MTLIAAFRCESSGRPGVVVCADSQETYGDYRVTVDKITPRDAGEYELIIGGAGNVAALIDGLAHAVEQNVKRWPAGLDEESARLRVERTLISYHARQVTHYPVEPHEKVLRFVVCVRDKTTSQIYLWKTDGPTAERVGKYALLGWEEAIYRHEVERLYYPSIQVGQAVLLGIHLFTIAKATSNYVGGETQVFVVRDDGVWLKLSDDVLALEKRLAAFNGALAELTLACPDSSIDRDEFQGLLLKFGESVMRLREHYAKHDVTSLFDGSSLNVQWKGEFHIRFIGRDEVEWADDGESIVSLRRLREPKGPADEEKAPRLDSETSEGQP